MTSKANIKSGGRLILEMGLSRSQKIYLQRTKQKGRIKGVQDAGMELEIPEEDPVGSEWFDISRIGNFSDDTKEPNAPWSVRFASSKICFVVYVPRLDEMAEFLR
jgi:hypothetical protein